MLLIILQHSEQQPHMTKNGPSQNVSNAAVEKPCSTENLERNLVEDIHTPAASFR